MSAIARVAVAVSIVAAVGAGYWFGRQATPQGEGSTATSVEASRAVTSAGSAAGSAAAGSSAAGSGQASGNGQADAGGRKVLYWYDPMAPQHRFDKPGKSPFMDMDLVPRYADEVDESGGVAVSSRLQQSLGIRTAEVKRTKIVHSFSAVGNVALDERSIVVITGRTAGIVERLSVRAVGDPVRRGQAVATLYVPEWAAAQAEYLAIRNARLASGDALVDAARQRLKIGFMPDEVIQRVDATGAPQPRVALTSPIDGFVAEVMAREGAQVSMGMPVMRLASLASVWVQIDVPESQAALARPGLAVEARSTAFPERRFAGAIETILPEVDPATRTLKARVVLKNEGNALRPGMYATVDISEGGRARESLVVPQEAVIATGKRSVVIVAEPNGRFRPVDVKTGREQGEDVEIVSGLAAGQKVVASGQFLIDSEASLRSALPRIAGDPTAGATGDAASGVRGGAAPGGAPGGAAGAPQGASGTAAAHRAEGTLDGVSKDALTITHGPVPALKWPGMTMEFRAPPGGLPAGVKAGDRIRFDFVRTPDDDWQVTRIEPMAAAGAPSSTSVAPSAKPAAGAATPATAAPSAKPGTGAVDHSAHGAPPKGSGK